MFTFIVYVPTLIQQPLSGLNLVQTQEFTILLIGSIGFTVFILQEKRLKKNLAEKSLIQRQVNRMTKDLTHSYSYIGEINRKLDILENITLGFPDSSILTLKQQSEIYGSIMGAIKIFGKSDNFSLRFVQTPKCEVIKEIKSDPDVTFLFKKEHYTTGNSIFENDEYLIVNSPKYLDNIFASIVIKKNSPHQQFEDMDIMKTLAAQALFLYMFMKRKKQIKCVI